MKVSTVSPQAVSPNRPSAASQTVRAQETNLSTDSHEGSVQGVFGRAVYGAALYGLPALTGAAMGPAGVVPGTLIGAGIGATTHLDSTSQAATFAAVGALVGGGLSWAAAQLSQTSYAWAPVVASAALGAATQALFSHTYENQESK
jgi:hypothetical protein